MGCDEENAATKTKAIQEGFQMCDKILYIYTLNFDVESSINYYIRL